MTSTEWANKRMDHPIGNCVSSYEDAGGRRLTTTYTANELNQYTAIQSAGAVPLRGDAAREETVSVNGALAERDDGTAAFTPWSFTLASDVTTAHYQNADILAVAQNVNGEDAVQSKSGSVFMPASETLLEYDDDGNTTFDGRFHYTWNAENRMIRAEEASLGQISRQASSAMPTTRKDGRSRKTSLQRTLSPEPSFGMDLTSSARSKISFRSTMSGGSTLTEQCKGVVVLED